MRTLTEPALARQAVSARLAWTKATRAASARQGTPVVAVLTKATRAMSARQGTPVVAVLTKATRALHRAHVVVTLLAMIGVLAVVPPVGAAPEGTMTWGVHITLASRWLDPAETEGIITPFMVLYALHDAMVKPMPAGINTPSLAESWTASKDGLTYEFVLRKGVKFHNGEPVTAADVKFSFERYKGAGATLLKERVREVQIVDPGKIRFVLKEPWPDFMTFYGTSATGASWVVPKAYVEKVGDDGFKRAPIGAGPYKFVSFN